MQKKRNILQKRVLSAISGLEKSHVTDEMQLMFTTMNDRALRATRKKPHLFGIPPVAALRIGKRLSTLLSYEPWVLHPEAVAEHHATRIAAKKLRYTMEIYGSIYRNNLEKPLARVKKMQEILGDIHDCDVWIDHITLHSCYGNGHSSAPEKEQNGRIPQRLSSLKFCLHNRETETETALPAVRAILAGTCTGTKLWDELRRLSGHRQERHSSVHQSSYPDDEANRSGQYSLHRNIPRIQSHSRHVTHLALMLFDDLQPLHNLGPHDRVPARMCRPAA